MGEFIESPFPVFATDSRGFVPSERILGDTVVHRIHLHHPALDPRGDTTKE